MKTIAELKRIANTGNYQAKMMYRYGEDIPERLQGWRKIVGSNTVAIFLLTSDNKKSELDIKRASLVEYTGSLLNICEAGERELNDSERKLMDDWETVVKTKEYQLQLERDLLTDGSSSFWEKKSFFKGHEYMLGHEFVLGKKYNRNTKKMIDMSVKGKLLIQYMIKEIKQNENI
jgi:hypothetical protein